MLLVRPPVPDRICGQFIQIVVPRALDYPDTDDLTITTDYLQDYLSLVAVVVNLPAIVADLSVEERLRLRYEKFRKMGDFEDRLARDRAAKPEVLEW